MTQCLAKKTVETGKIPYFVSFRPFLYVRLIRKIRLIHLIRNIRRIRRLIIRLIYVHVQMQLHALFNHICLLLLVHRPKGVLLALAFTEIRII